MSAVACGYSCMSHSERSVLVTIKVCRVSKDGRHKTLGRGALTAMLFRLLSCGFAEGGKQCGDSC